MDNNINNTTNTQIEQPQGGKGMAIGSLICGIASLLLCCFWYVSLILSIVAIVLGIISRKKTENGKGMALAGIITGAIGAVIALVLGVFAIFVSSAVNGMSPDEIIQYFESLS